MASSPPAPRRGVSPRCGQLLPCGYHTCHEPLGHLPPPTRPLGIPLEDARGHRDRSQRHRFYCFLVPHRSGPCAGAYVPWNTSGGLAAAGLLDAPSMTPLTGPNDWLVWGITFKGDMEALRAGLLPECEHDEFTDELGPDALDTFGSRRLMIHAVLTHMRLCEGLRPGAALFLARWEQERAWIRYNCYQQIGREPPDYDTLVGRDPLCPHEEFSGERMKVWRDLDTDEQEFQLALFVHMHACGDVWSQAASALVGMMLRPPEEYE